MPSISPRRFGLIPMLTAATVSLAAPGVAAETVSGSAVWSAQCAKCHRDPARIAASLPAASDDAGKARLDAFLTKHHATDPKLRAALVEWLVSQTRQ
ncbi:hypothetical protein [Alloyangia pacifica]|uniref:Cytochrome c domain-containing protein n=1 Tax=Alloyangia pacifica TaxID=311180 RepID=A0A1I6VMR2_9RHOB|nr:hypothetical protein [Alloyangia pacifica]SDI06235.1 hypothetical protein SAMN04488245_11228 [Alloyangia pacifica]SFT14996.1 hypothetical protein SAMN04488050_11228 [Alloyangia pacifica]